MGAEQEKIARLQRSLAAELETAKTMSSHRTSIVYGAQIMVQHVESELYLNMTTERAQQDGALMCKLAADGPRAGFTICPGYKSSAMGDKVQFGQGMMLSHDILKSYIHVATPRSGKLADCVPTQDQAVIHEYVQTILECNGLNRPSVFVAKPFRLLSVQEEVTAHNRVRGSDAITLYSTESNRYLSVVDINPEDPNDAETYRNGYPSHMKKVTLKTVSRQARENILDTSIFWRIHNPMSLIYTDPYTARIRTRI